MSTIITVFIIKVEFLNIGVLVITNNKIVMITNSIISYNT